MHSKLGIICSHMSKQCTRPDTTGADAQGVHESAQHCDLPSNTAAAPTYMIAVSNL